MTWHICVNSWSFVYYLSTSVNGSIADMYKRWINNKLVKWQHINDKPI